MMRGARRTEWSVRLLRAVSYVLRSPSHAGRSFFFLDGFSCHVKSRHRRDRISWVSNLREAVNSRASSNSSARIGRVRGFRDDQRGSTAKAFAIALAVLAIGAKPLLLPGTPSKEQPVQDAPVLSDPVPVVHKSDPPERPKKSAGVVPGRRVARENVTPAMRIARSFIGKSETEHAEMIGAFIVRLTGNSLDVRETPWCAAFVNAVLKASGIDGTGSLSARSFLQFGTETQMPKPGDIAVFSRGDPNGRAGHVGFYAWEIERDGEIYIRIVGGNQGDSVSEQLYPKSRLLGYRRPPPIRAGQKA